MIDTVLGIRPETVYAEQNAQRALDSIEYVRNLGWLHGEFMTLVEVLEQAYAQGHADGLEFAGEDCQNGTIDDPCECACHD